MISLFRLVCIIHCLKHCIVTNCMYSTPINFRSQWGQRKGWQNNGSMGPVVIFYLSFTLINGNLFCVYVCLIALQTRQCLQYNLYCCIYKVQTPHNWWRSLLFYQLCQQFCFLFFLFCFVLSACMILATVSMLSGIITYPCANGTCFKRHRFNTCCWLFLKMEW